MKREVGPCTAPAAGNSTSDEPHPLQHMTSGFQGLLSVSLLEQLTLDQVSGDVEIGQVIRQ